MTGDQNGWVEGRIMMTITGAFGIHSENDNKKRVTGFYAEKGLCVGKMYLKHRWKWVDMECN